MRLHFLLLCGVLAGCTPTAGQLAQPAPDEVSAAKPVAAPATPSAPPQPAGPALPTVRAPELQKEWESHRAEVIARYKGKVIAVTGMIADMKRDPSDDGYYVTFTDPRGYFANGLEVRGAGWWLVDVICSFDGKDQLAGLDNHEPVTIIGEVKLTDRITLIHCQSEKAFRAGVPQPVKP